MPVRVTRLQTGKKKFLGGSRGLTLVSHNAVGSKEFERGHFKQCWVEQKFSGCWSASGFRLQALLNELLERGTREWSRHLASTPLCSSLSLILYLVQGCVHTRCSALAERTNC